MHRIKKSFTKLIKNESLRQLHRHPLFIATALILGTLFFAYAIFIQFGGQIVSPEDSHVVNLHLDGETRVLPTRAKTVGDLIDRLNIEIKQGDVVEPGLDADITDDNFQINIYRAQQVTIVDGSKKVSVLSAQQTPRDIVKQAGIKLYPEDNVVPAPADDPLADGLISQRLVVERATPIVLYIYGTAAPLRTHAKTVGDLLKERNITLLAGDTVNPAETTPITADMLVFVLGAGKKVESREELIPNNTNYIDDPSIPLGQTQVKDAGAPGKKLVIYEVDASGGGTALQEVVVSEPVTRVVLRGTKLVETRIAGDKSAILSAAGVPANQHYAADAVIARESGWNLAARNSSGCLGLGQACPGSKLVAACPAWQTDANCQIQFFSGYANSRYGSWNSAYQFWLVNHWW